MSGKNGGCKKVNSFPRLPILFTNARLELEEKTGKQVVSPLNAKDGIVLKGHEEK